MTMTKEELLSQLKEQEKNLERFISIHTNEENKRIHSEALKAIRGLNK
ncbi:hypothetical protein [Peribacillus frigoritolerans]|nr:hypothetical protein [Peribacillus frigoritolerans]